MLYMAIWVLEQEAAWINRNFSTTSGSSIDSFDKTLPLIAFSGVGAFQTAAISISPYYHIYSQASAFGWVADDLAWSKKHPYWSKVVPRTGHWYNYHPGLLSFAKRSAGRGLAVRIGARAIPYAGWALLALDVYRVSQWYMANIKQPLIDWILPD